MSIAKNSVVTMHYALKNDGGDDLGSSHGHEPMAYLHGNDNIVPGLEKELDGKKAGDKINAVVSPEEGYGIRNEDGIRKIDKARFEGDEEITVGMQIQVDMEGEVSVASVTDIDEKEITLDLNHPLAGETLHFEIEIMGVRDATVEELSHGHVHGPGGHHH
ncbi:MAG TPA: peptidylprolyl isomerase [Flavobacteriales bacterium]|nr:peptidylprolyl isomerase [Flavobacteriales bacterium]